MVPSAEEQRNVDQISPEFRGLLLKQGVEQLPQFPLHLHLLTQTENKQFVCVVGEGASLLWCLGCL